MSSDSWFQSFRVMTGKKDIFPNFVIASLSKIPLLISKGSVCFDGDQILCCQYT